MKLFAKILLILLVIAVLLACIPYVITPIYDFPAKQKFSGNKFYNPYENIKSDKWLKANFHAHSYAWWGFTNGRENIAEEMKERYVSLDYDVFSISDYMKVNTLFINEKIFIPVYEHGYGFTKNHQLVIGAKEVKWLDYIFMQTLSDKQRTLKEIKRDNNIIVLNHPHLRDAYSPEDVKELTGFDYIEIINQNHGTALDLWDEALSAGNPVFGITGEDSHNSKNYIDMGKCFNMINTDTASEQGVLEALKIGKVIAVDLVTGNGNYKVLKERSSKVILPEDFKIFGDVVSLKFPSEVKEIRFIGQNGKLTQSEKNTDSASYAFLQQDTYIRTEVTLNNGSKIYFNPVIRYNGNKLPVYSAFVDKQATFIFRGLMVIILAVVILTVYLFRRKNKKVIPDVRTAEL
jgi:hypothetical protein